MTGFIDYEAAWNEAKNRLRFCSTLNLDHLWKIEGACHIPTGTPLTPRQAWLALARGGKVVDPENDKHWFILLGNGEVEYRDGRLLYMLGWMFNVLNSGQAVIMEEPATAEAGEKAAESFKPYQIPKDQLDAFMEGLQKGSDKLYGEKPSVPIEETQALDPRCDACAWGTPCPDSDRRAICHKRSIVEIIHPKSFWCSHFLPRDRSQVRCETCKNWTREGNNVLHGSECLEGPYGVSKLATSTCGRWAVIPPAWR
jgi:hypothetical protein